MRNRNDRLSQPSGLTEEEKVQLASTVIQRAVRNGLSEVQVYRFPNSLCNDKGRAINQMEKGWEKTLSGIPKEIRHSSFSTTPEQACGARMFLSQRELVATSSYCAR